MKKTLPLAIAAIALIITGAGCQDNNSAPTTEENITPTTMEETTTTPEEPSEIVLSDGTYLLNQEESSLAWSANRVAYGHNGLIDILSGEVKVEDGQVIEGEFVVDMTSLESLDQEGEMKEKLETHLKSEDFFDVEKYPETKFELTSFTPEQADGELTIKGITNRVSFPVKTEVKDGQIVVTAEFEIDRTLWDIQYGSGKFFKGLGDKLIKDEIKFNLELVVDQE